MVFISLRHMWIVMTGVLTAIMVAVALAHAAKSNPGGAPLCCAPLPHHYAHRAVFGLPSSVWQWWQWAPFGAGLVALSLGDVIITGLRRTRPTTEQPVELDTEFELMGKT